MNFDKLKAFLSQPLVGGIGVLASIISIPLSIYFFFVTQEYPELTYHVTPAKTAVVRPGQATQLAVLYQGKQLAGDVTAAQVAIWNAGRKVITRDAVRKPLLLRVSSGRILEAAVQKVNRDVVEIKLDQSRIAGGELRVDWNALEQGDGGVIQLVYAGDENVEITADAVLHGQPSIAVSRSFAEKPNRKAERVEKVLPYIVIVAGLAMTLVVPFATRRFGLARTTPRGPEAVRAQRRLRRVMTIYLWIMGPVTVLLGLVMRYMTASGPPFGF